MTDLLSTLYPWIKSLHVMAVLSWMAGLFYLPRLFVYHAERGDRGAEMAASFRIMEDKLLRMIMNPAMIVSWICGIALVLTPGIVGLVDVLALDQGRCRAGDDLVSHVACRATACAGGRPWLVWPQLSDDERAADAADGGHRDLGDREVLKFCRFPWEAGLESTVRLRGR